MPASASRLERGTEYEFDWRTPSRDRCRHLEQHDRGNDEHERLGYQGRSQPARSIGGHGIVRVVDRFVGMGSVPVKGSRR